MGSVAFKLDLNFAFVIYSQLASDQERSRLIETIESFTDRSLTDIIERNFFKTAYSEDTYLYIENEADSVVIGKKK